MSTRGQRRKSSRTLLSQLEKADCQRERVRLLNRLSEVADPRDVETLDRVAALAAKDSLLRGVIGRLCLRLRRRRWQRELAEERATYSDPEVRGAAREILEDAPVDVRLRFVHGLIENEVFEVADLLAERWESEASPAVRRLLLEALGALGGEVYAEELKRASRDLRVDCRLGALEGLRHVPGRIRAQVFTERFGDPSDEVRGRLIEILRTVDPGELVEVLKRIPTGKALEIRRGSVRFLRGHLDHPGVHRLLRSYLRDPRSLLRAEALLTLAAAHDPEAGRAMDDLRGGSRLRDLRLLALAEHTWERGNVNSTVVPSGATPRRRDTSVERTVVGRLSDIGLLASA